MNWKHLLAAGVFGLCLGLAVMAWVGRDTGPGSAADAGLVAQIAELEHEMDVAKTNAVVAHEEADAERASRAFTIAELNRTRKALAAAKKKGKKLPVSDEVVLLRGQNTLLEFHLASALKEAQNLRVSRTYCGMGLSQCIESKDIMTKRYTALRRSKKKEKRLRIVQQVGTHAGVFVLGWVGGKYANQ